MEHRFILVHGMKRSGNHAVIQWMLAQGEFAFCNNLVPIAGILRGAKTMPPPRDFALWREEKAPGAADVCASLEDFPPDVRPFHALPPGAAQVLIVRDPANFFASRIRKAGKVDHPAYPRETGPAMTRVVESWKAHAREFLGLTSHLANKVPVYFNAWFADRSYRQGLSARLGLLFSDAGFAQVSDTGGGSSFDRTAFDGDNHLMKVLDRQSQLTAGEARLLSAVLADEELIELGRRIAEDYSLGTRPR